MPLVFKRTDDEDYPRYLKILIQGPPKAGKTTFVSTAPNALIAATPDAGLASIAHLGVPFVEVNDTDTLQQLEMVLRDDALRAKAAAKVGLPSIDTIVIDTLDNWQDILKKEILAENRQTQMQQKDWGTLKERMASILKRFITLPMNVIFTVHTSTTQDEEARLVYMPALQGSIKDEVAGYVDYSLLAYRERQTGADGVARVNYYLKTEGDTKNPTIGNRSAGRIPEVSPPDFKYLHKKHFDVLDQKMIEQRSAGVIISGDESPGVSPEASIEAAGPAQSASSPSRTLNVPEPAPSGVPEDDPEAPINASGFTMLTKAYVEQGFVVPEDLKRWNLGKARKVMKWFMAWKTDMAAGVQSVTRDDLIAGLSAFEAFSGEMEGVQTGVENLKAKPAAVEQPTPAEPEVKPAPEQTEEGATRLLQDQLGARVVSYDLAADAECQVCHKQVDDLDIAKLAVGKFQQPMCVTDYKNAVKEARSG